MHTSGISRGRAKLAWLPGLAALALLAVCGIARAQTPTCERTITANVVAFDQPFFWNRLGAVQPQGMIFALRRDVVPQSGSLLSPGNVKLRDGKRARPLVLRMNEGDCLRVIFQNLLNPSPEDEEQPRTRTASVHVAGLQLVNSISSDGSNVGTNPNSLVGPGGSITYTLYGEREGVHLLYSTAATTGGEGDGGQIPPGLFGAVTVNKRGARWYRSQVTEADLRAATIRPNPNTTPVVNYNAVYPAGHPRAGLPILAMLQNNEIVHSDLTAIITGSDPMGATEGRFPEGTYPPNPSYVDRNQPFREYTIVYHDEIGAVQAFPEFNQPQLEHTLHSVRDAFAINYGTGGIGAEILANRIGVGPMHNCTACLYEDFFLSAWAVADPAMIVDVPANSPCTKEDIRLGRPCNPTPGPKATKAFFPDDPSNVYHSYIRDHVKFRIVHAGPKEHHIHHQHAHQWLHTPNADTSTVLDSQAIGPGSSFTLEQLHHGSGNRNQTVGDAIFHCHFYPHFAMGMWGMWRVHDVFEAGTVLGTDGRPVAGARALPDGEIVRGTPIPAIVPVPSIAIAPPPEARAEIVQLPGVPGGQVKITGAGNPGYPFFVPGIAGQRITTPPLDLIHDGGLPRHIIKGGVTEEVHNRFDFNKEIIVAQAEEIPQGGTPTEQAAMNYHGTRNHPSFTPSGRPANFVTNGLPNGPQSGAPYADPCIDDNGVPIGTRRLYKLANFQFDMKINKAAWHHPQSRISALWLDVIPTLNGQRPPEPLFFRANTNDCIEMWTTNLIPRLYELDDFQVRTPTDITGQHVHLVKFDVTSSDGAANGFNYEDGTYSPEEVFDRIEAINAGGGLKPFGGGAGRQLAPVPHIFFGAGPDKNGDGHPDYLGAQTTVQRWFADAVLNNAVNGAQTDRTLRTAFTHDHFGPSTHQQTGLYAGLVIEPKNSTWRDSENGAIFGTRHDGGPTRFRADILTENPANSFREFLFNFQDFQLGYVDGGGIDGQGRPIPDPPRAINPPGRKEVGLPFLLARPDRCPTSDPNLFLPPPCPEAISADDPGTFSVNYRNEPAALRVRNPSTNTQAAGEPGDLSNVFRSDITRADGRLNVQPNFYPPLVGDMRPGDPFTPLLRAYENDKVQIRILVGAHEEGHNFTVHGMKWLFEQDFANSGFRNSQMMGISEHYEFVIPPLPKNNVGSTSDYLYANGWSVDDLWNGLWGIVRAYGSRQQDLLPLPNNPNGNAPFFNNRGEFNGVCHVSAPRRTFDVTAVTAAAAIPGGTLVYNRRPGKNNEGPLHDPTAIMFVRTADLNASGVLNAGVPIEPLILRAAAGDCIELTLRNRLPASPPDLNGFNTFPMIVDNFNANQVRPSAKVGLHPQMLFFDVTRSNGVNVGFNPVQTVNPGASTTYQWYAGEVRLNTVTGNGDAIPIEFGTTGLMSSDPIKHSNKGALGALIIEPRTALWTELANTRAVADIIKPNNITGPEVRFREFVTLYQNDINLRYRGNTAVPNTAEAEDPEDSGQKAINYRTEPLWFRRGFAPDTPLEQTRNFDFTNILTDGEVGGRPVTPLFRADPGQSVRFRLLHPGGHARNNTYMIHGHIWEEEPYTDGSTKIGSNPLSEWVSTRTGVGPSSHFDEIPKNGAGGKFRVTGEYLYRTFMSFQFDGGMWGIFRVGLNQSPGAIISANPTNGPAPLTVTFRSNSSDLDGEVVRHQWNFGDNTQLTQVTATQFTKTYQTAGAYNAQLTATDNEGATATTSVQIFVANPGSPSAPINLQQGQGVAVTPTTLMITLAWTDTSTNETGFRIERSDNQGTTWTSVTTVPANITSVGNIPVQRDGQFHQFRVRAINAAGDSAPSNVVSIFGEP